MGESYRAEPNINQIIYSDDFFTEDKSSNPRFGLSSNPERIGTLVDNIVNF
jgi:hypothetical protein